MIACIGFGSLIWDPRTLAMRGDWNGDGPMLPVEFARQSHDGRMTLVILPGAAPVRTYWARMDCADLASAAESLRVREGIIEHRPEWIGRWSRGETGPIGDWAGGRFDHVIWTALPCRFDGEDHRLPTADQAVTYLQTLDGDVRARAEEYVRRAPPQTETAFRRRFEVDLGWTP